MWSPFILGPDGKKKILLSTFHQHIEFLGHDGYKPSGWPLSFEDSTFQGSPMLYDIDGDGTNDIGVVDKNGNLFWIRIGEYGQYLEDYHIQVPKLKIKRDWASGLDPKFTDNYIAVSMFDHSTDKRYGALSSPDQSLFAKDKSDAEKSVISAKIKADDLGPIKQDSYPELNKKFDTNEDLKSSSEVSESSSSNNGRSRRLLSIPDEMIREGRDEKQDVSQPTNLEIKTAVNRVIAPEITDAAEVPVAPADTNLIAVPVAPAVTNVEVPVAPAVTNVEVPIAPAVTNVVEVPVAPVVTNVEVIAPAVTNVDVIAPAVTNVEVIAPAVTNIDVVSPAVTNVEVVSPAVTNVDTVVNGDLEGDLDLERPEGEIADDYVPRLEQFLSL